MEHIATDHGGKPKTGVPPSDSEMLRWVALYVTDINSLNGRRGERVELISADDAGASMIIVARSGKTIEEAFRKCVIASMKQMPPRKARQ